MDLLVKNPDQEEQPIFMVLLMEKLGAIRSADEFGTAAILRNKFAHHYPEATTDRIARLNLVIEESDFVIKVFNDVLEFLRIKGHLSR